MIYLIDHRNRHLFGKYLMQIHRQRYEYFVQARGWFELESFFHIEVDQYDGPTASYIAVIDEGRVIASIRVMPTSLGTFLEESHKGRILPEYRPYPFCQETWEMFRLLVTDDKWRWEGHPAVRVLMIGMYEYLLGQGAKRLVAVSDTGLLRKMPPEWPFREIGAREKFLQRDLPDGESTLVEIELHEQVNELTRRNRQYRAGQLQRAEDALAPAKIGYSPEELFVINRWLVHHPERIHEVRGIVKTAENKLDGYDKFNELVTECIAWDWGSNEGRSSVQGIPVWH